MTSFDKFHAISEKNSSLLCVGIDPDINKLPAPFAKSISSLADFCTAIIEATRDICAAYKINAAFFEQYGIEGMRIMEQVRKSIPDDIFTIYDAKRGDIGNTSRSYALAAFGELDFDSITVSPYMGHDSVQPFLGFPDKMVFLLALTSNPGSADFQRLICEGKPLYRHVMERSMHWGGEEQLGFVVGATHPEELAGLREISKRNIFLIPGIGAQGGDLDATLAANGNAPALINMSRALLFASSGSGFAEAARAKAAEFNETVRKINSGGGL